MRVVRVCGLRFIVFLFLVTACGDSASFATPQQTGTTTNKGSGKNGAAKPTDAVNDTLPNVFLSQPTLLDENDEPRASSVKQSIIAIQQKQAIPWRGIGVGMSKLVQTQLTNQPSATACSADDSTQMFVFHINHWKKLADKSFQLRSSSWYAYTLGRDGSLKFAGVDSTGAQSVYGKTKALIVGISGFDNEGELTGLQDFQDTYSATVVQGTPENLTNLGLLISGVGGFGGKVTSLNLDGNPVSKTPYFVTIGCQLGTPKLPFELTVTDATISQKDQHPAKSSNGGSVSCSGTSSIAPCESTHTFESVDKEYWDVSVGVTTPGTRETKYTFSSGTVQSKITRHTDFYGMFDFFPLAALLPKDSPVPHIAIGLPLTSQTFYRPFFGLSENLTGWTSVQRRLSLPVGINFFAGVVYMKTEFLLDSPTTQPGFNTDLKYTRVWKGVFGVEVPLRAMASKLGKKAGGSSAKSGGTSTASD
jgi:hypothetical protein